MNQNKFMLGSPVLMGDNRIPGVSVPEELRVLLPEIYRKVSEFGCDFPPTVVEMLTYDEMSEVAAYGGFPVRYPHWKWGMEYEELQRGYMHGQHRIYEMIVNSSPCYLYCLDSNSLLDNVTVVAHALGHADFFKNNIFFSQTSQNMMNELANHGTRIRRYMSRWGKERVTEFIDYVLRIETLIDPSKAWTPKRYRDNIPKDSRKYRHPGRLKVEEGHDYMDKYINTEEWIRKQQDKIDRIEAAEYMDLFVGSTKDIMGFIRDNAPLKPWESDIVSMLYEESLYFAPQRMTKVANEGMACVGPETLIATNEGILTAKELVEGKISCLVSDGEGNKKVSNWFIFEDRKTVEIETRRGYKITGSDNHRILDSEGQWVHMRDLNEGVKLRISGSNVWPKDPVSLDYKEEERLNTRKIREILGSKYWKYNYYRMGMQTETQAGPKVVELSKIFDEQVSRLGETQAIRRKKISIPNEVTEDLASFLGYMIGDGHISETGRSFGLTSGDLEQIENYENLLGSLFGLNGKRKWDGSSKNGRWRVSCSSKSLQEFLKSLGLKTGVCAREKTVPDCILKSPKNVVSAFLRSYFDCDGYGGDGGVILSTASEKMGEQIQTILLNYSILASRKRVKSSDEKKTHVWHVRMGGLQVKKFMEQIGFGLKRKQDSLGKYVNDRFWFTKENWTDEIVSIKTGCGTVYDITVDETHRYAAHGFVNHNSWVDYNIIARQGLGGLGQDHDSGGIIEYAKHKMGVLGGKYSMNPYRLGFNLLCDIEERWDKGRFGSAWDDCTDAKAREDWDLKLGLGREKVFEVRKLYNDAMLISEFFTPEFCEKHEFFEWKRYPNGEYKIESKDSEKIKRKLLARHLNGGLPDIRLVDPNHQGRGVMLLQHAWTGRELHESYVGPVLEALRKLWKRDILLATRSKSGEERVYRCRADRCQVDVVNRENYDYDNNL
jgi:stage V sporulation protein R